MPGGTLSTASQELSIGPVPRGEGVICLHGVMTAGWIVLMVQPPTSSDYFASDEITAEKLQRVRDPDGSGYGYVSGFVLPTGGQVKLVTSYNFVGSLLAFVGPGGKGSQTWES